MRVIVLYSIREQPSHMSTVLCTPSTTPTTNLWQIFFSLYSSIVGLIIFWAAVCPSGPEWKCHSQGNFYWGEGGDYFLIFSNCANAQVLFSGATVCTLSDWERQVCVWLSYHLRLLFASVSADWAFLPASLPELMMNYKRACSPREYRCFHTHTHTYSLLFFVLDGSRQWKASQIIVQAIQSMGNEDLLCELDEKTAAN